MSFEFLEINSNNKLNSSDFTYTLNKGITLEDGDTVQLHSIFLDTRRQSTGTINISQPLTISMEFYYYVINANFKKGQVNASGVPINSAGETLPNPNVEDSQFHEFDGLPYILKCQYNGADYRPLIGVWQYTIPIGNYQPADLAALISKAMQSADINTIMDPESSNTIMLYPETNNTNKYTTPFLTPVWNSSKISTSQEDAFNSQSLDPSDIAFTNLPNYVMFGDNTFYNQSSNFPYRRYYFGPLIQGSIYPPFIYNEYINENSSYISYLLGTDSPALEYNIDGSGRFSLNYLHRPLRQAGKNIVSVNIKRHFDVSQTDVAKIKRSDNKLVILTAESGILLKDLQPREFWINILGFDTNTITIDITTFENQLITLDRFKAATTEQLWSISAMNTIFYNGSIKRGISVWNTSGYPSDLDSSPTNTMVGTSFNELQAYDSHLNPACFPNADNAYLKLNDLTYSIYKSYSQSFQQDDTRYIVGVNPFIDPNDYGHYLVEIKGIGENEYNNDTDKLDIHGIISKYYIQNNYLSGDISSSLMYIHNGGPYSTKSLYIRILNPSTKLPALLGQSNYLYLQITHNQQQKSK